jgi:SAM-dependent methyltransferase
VRCNTCGLVFPKRIFPSELFENFYAHSNIQYEIWKSELEVLREKLKTHTLPKPAYVDKILAMTNEEKKLLDIGCGLGETLHHLKPYFGTVEGVELNKFTSYEGSKLFDVKIYNMELSKAKLKKGSYDCIMLDNVIEHLGNMDIFYEIHRLLKPGGILYIETPYVDSLSMRIFKEEHNAVDNFEHIALFNFKSFRALANKYDFIIEDYRTDDTLDIQLNDLLKKNSKNFIHRFNNVPFINPINMALFTFSNLFFSKTKLLSRYNLGSYIEVVLRKKSDL